MSLEKLLAVFIIAGSLLVMQCSEELVVPEELIGVWQTTYSGYEGRNIEITRKTLIFERGGGYFDFATYPIVGLDRILEDGDILYIIHYVNPEGYKYKFSIYYSPKDGGTFRFRHRTQIKWARKKNN